MRTLTTDWNNSSYNDAASFVDKSGAVMNIAAGNPVNHRSMMDSVNGGDWSVIETPDALSADSVADAESVAALATTDVVVTLEDAATDPVAGVRVTATSADTNVFTVSPAQDVTDANGQITFTITGVAAGGPEDLTFAVASMTSITKVVAVTVTE